MSVAVRYRFVRPAQAEMVGRGIDRLERVEATASRFSPALFTPILQSSQNISNSSDAIAAPIADAAAVGADFLPDQDQDQGAAGNFFSPSSSLSPAVRSPLVEIEDGRKITPSQMLFPTERKWVSRLQVAKAQNRSFLPHGIAVKASSFVLLCIRRKSRRGVLLALGQGGGYHRPPRRAPNSDIWC